MEINQTLNARQEAFCQKVASGESASRAYQQVYDASPATAEASASRLLGNVKVSDRIHELQAAAANEAVLTLQAKRRMMKTIAEDESLAVRDRIRAIELDAKLAGEFPANKVDLTSSDGSMTLQQQAQQARIEGDAVLAALRRKYATGTNDQN